MFVFVIVLRTICYCSSRWAATEDILSYSSIFASKTTCPKPHVQTYNIQNTEVIRFCYIQKNSKHTKIVELLCIEHKLYVPQIFSGD